MQKLLFSAVILIGIMASCNKNKEGEDLVTGNWKMIKTYTGWGGVHDVPAGETFLLKISRDHHFREYHNDTLKFEGEWKVYSRVLYMTNSKGWIFKDISRNLEWAINRQGHELEFYQDGVSDGGGVVYEHY